MGNYKFRLSDMMPNAWFYKLRDMSSVRNSSKKKRSTTTPHSSQQNSKKPHPNSHPRKSYYFTRELKTPNERFYNSPPRKSLQNRARGRKATSIAIRSSSNPSPTKLISSTVSPGCSRRTITSSAFDDRHSSPEPKLLVHDHYLPSPEYEFRSDNVLPTESSVDDVVSLSSSCASGIVSSSDKDIIIDVDKNSLSRKLDDKAEDFDSSSGHELPPIVTKNGNFDNYVKKKQNKKDAKRGPWCKLEDDYTPIKVNSDNKNSPARRRFPVSSGSPGVRLRINSPKISSSRKLHGYSRKSISSSESSWRRGLSDSFAVVKASHNPQSDFKESMMEMIVENNIRASKDLEDLLACYLSLNSDEYHRIIIKVFRQIWFDLADHTRLN